MAVVGAISSIAGGVMGMMQAQYQAKVANMNAAVAKENAARAVEKASIEGEDNDLQTKALLGEQEVAQAASGISLSGKSQILTRRSAHLVGRRDTMNIIHKGKVEEYNYLVDAANFKAQAQAAKMSGISSLVGGVLGAAGSFAGSAGSGGFGSSLLGGSTATASPARYIATPVPKPLSLSPSPLLGNKFSVANPQWSVLAF